MGIFDRLKRLAQAEITEMKRVLADRDAPEASQRRGPESEEDARRRAIREAEEELARAEDDVLAAEIEAGAALWGNPSRASADAPANSGPGPRPGVVSQAELDRGAAAWGAPPIEEARPRPAYDGRTHAFPREIRDAYAALELPLGSDKAAVERAFRDLLHRYHPDKHAGDARREALAHDLTVRIREARDLLSTWLARG